MSTTTVRSDGEPMRVAELVGIREFRLVDGEISDPAPGEVQVRVEAVGICGSDMHGYSEGCVGDSPCVYPMVLGHEPAGTVVKVGAGVTGWSAGALVACEPAQFCYHCEPCRSGRPNLCTALRFLSQPGEPGFFRQRVNLPARNVLALPPTGVSAAEGALVEPLAVVLHSLSLAPPVLGDTAVVFGAGPIGLLTIAVLKLSGVTRVWAVEPLAHRRALAQQIGADAALAPTDGAAAAIVAETGGRGVDLAFDCAAKGDTANDCLEVARRGGRVVYTGIHSEPRTSLEFHRWRRKELALYQVRRSCHEGEAARDLLVRHIRRFAPLLTHSRPLGEIDAAFALVESYADGVGKLTLRPDGA